MPDFKIDNLRYEGMIHWRDPVHFDCLLQMKVLQYDGTRSGTRKTHHEAKRIGGEGCSELAEGYTQPRPFSYTFHHLLPS